MIRFNFLLAFRSILKNRATSAINLFGLSVAFTALLMIVMYVVNELSYDRYNKNSERIYRISRESLDANGIPEIHFGHVNFALANHLRSDFGQEVESVVRFNNNSNSLVAYEAGGKSFVEPNLFFADPEVFDVFTWNLINGSKETVLQDINSIAISSAVAQRYFGKADPLGKMLLIDNQVSLMVTGVFEDVPSNSHFKPAMLMSMSTREKLTGFEDLMRNPSNNDATYVLLKPGADIRKLEAEMPGVLDRYYGTSADGRKSSDSYRYHFWALNDLHLFYQYDSSTEPNGNYAMVYVFLATAVLILLIACINFINLSTARLTQRAKEVGLKKAIGAMRFTLFSQFITESFLFALFSLVVSIGAAQMLLPSFNAFVDKSLSLSSLVTSEVGLAVLAILLVVSLVAGGYPAFYLSSFRASDVLKSGARSSWKKLSVRSVLVGLQFFLAFLLIIFAVIVRDQVRFMSNYNVGFNGNTLLVMPASQEITKNFKSIKHQLEEQPGIQRVSISSRVPSGRLADAQDASVEVNGQVQVLNLRIAYVSIDHDYFNVLGLPFVAGRNFNYSLSSDSLEGFILNETAVKAIGWNSNEEAIGKLFHYGDARKGNIIGVVKDFNFEYLHEPIKPAVFVVVGRRARSVLVRIDENKKDETLKYLTEQWSYWRPGYPFTYYTLSDNFKKQYDQERKAGEGISFFAAFAVFVSSLGVFGLALFMVEQRSKEMGIRKVLGASTPQIMMILGSWFFVLLFLAGALSLPLSYWLAKSWLGTFAFSAGIGYAPYVISFGLIATCTVLSVGIQIGRTAAENPVKALRYE